MPDAGDSICWFLYEESPPPVVELRLERYLMCHVTENIQKGVGGIVSGIVLHIEQAMNSWYTLSTE